MKTSSNTLIYHIKTCYCFLVIAVMGICMNPSIYAQGMVKGIVLDKDFEPHGFVNVILLTFQDSTFIKGSSTTDSGEFVIDEIPEGQYHLQFSSLGYTTLFTELKIAKGEEVILPEVYLNQDAALIEEVTISARRTLYEQKSDRLIINVAGLPGNFGNNALQVLQKAPGVILQEYNNTINLNGKGNVQVMINNRVSRVPLTTLFAQLRGMSAENIERIEIIHQPPAEYEAGNLSGIIHIVLKKNNQEGLNGNVSIATGYGEKFKSNGSISFNYRKQALNIYGDITGFNNFSPTVEINHFRTYNFEGIDYYFENTFIFENEIQRAGSANLGLDYTLSPKTTMGILLGYNQFYQIGTDYPSSSEFYENGALISKSKYLIQTQNPNTTNFQNFNIIHKINSESELSFDLDRVRLALTNYNFLEELSAIPNTVRVDRNTTFDIYTFSGDYYYKLHDRRGIKAGVKGSINNSDSNFLRKAEQEVIIESESIDQFEESLYSAYISVNQPLGKNVNADIGLRYERYHFVIDQQGQMDQFDVLYNNLFPTANISYNIDSLQKLSFTFNRRTARASYFFIAGFYFIADPSLTILTNNKIRPSFANTLRLSYQYRSFLISFEASRIRDAIDWYNRVDKSNHTQISNIVNNERFDLYQLQMSLPLYLTKFWEANFTVNGGYQFFSDAANRPIAYSTSIFNYGIQFNNLFTVNKNMNISLDGRYLSPLLAGDQVHLFGPALNIALNYKLPSQASLTFSILDVTRTAGYNKWEYDHISEKMKTNGFNDFSERLFMVSYTQPFGNQQLKAKRNRETGSQEERSRM